MHKEEKVPAAEILSGTAWRRENPVFVPNERHRQIEIKHMVLIGCFFAAVAVAGGAAIWWRGEHAAPFREKVAKIKEHFEKKVADASAELSEYLAEMNERAAKDETGYQWFQSLFRRKPTFADTDVLQGRTFVKVDRDKAEQFLAKMKKEHPELKELGEDAAKLFMGSKQLLCGAGAEAPRAASFCYNRYTCGISSASTKRGAVRSPGPCA